MPSKQAKRPADVAHQARQQGSHLAQSAQDRTSQAVEEYPLAVGAACLGLGLVVGLALPPSRQENRWFGETSDDFKNQAKETAQEAFRRGKDVARDTGQAAMEEAERQGLTPEQVGERIREGASHIQETAREEAAKTGDLREKAERVAETATETAKNRSKEEAESTSS